MFKRVIVDGGDGSGKSTLVRALKRLGYNAQDRGRATDMTLDSTLEPEPDALYLILDVPVHVALERLRRAGKSMDESWHRPESLRHFRMRYLEIALRLPYCVLLDATEPFEELLLTVLQALNERGISIVFTAERP